jgi:hypothetical protein
MKKARKKNEDHMGKNVPEYHGPTLKEWAREHPSDAKDGQLTVMEFFGHFAEDDDDEPDKVAADEMLDELGIRRWFRR